MNKYFRKFNKNAKALSPVVASIILIAVTVAVSVVVAAWMGGMTVGLMGSAEQVAITNVQFTSSTTDTMIITIQNTGDTSVSISNAFVDNVAITAANTGTNNPILKSTTSTVTLTLGAGALDSGTQYSIKLVTLKGNSLVYTATYNGA